MGFLKKIVFLLALLLAGVLNALIYWNHHLYYLAKNEENSDQKIRILKKANKLFPFNDLVHYEMGKANFDSGIQNLSLKSKSDEFFQESVQNFKQSIRVNPASSFSHFNFAQSLFYGSALSPYLEDNPYEEMKKAALLAGQNSQIYYEVGKMFLSRWSKLSEEDRVFCLEILKKILGGKNTERMQTLLHIWEMNARNYEIVEKILPEDPFLYRLYATFLGEKSLSLEERQKFLAKAEFLEFEKAKSQFQAGENELVYFRAEEAFHHFGSCLENLEQIKLYQNLVREKLINLPEFHNLKKLIFLNLAKSRLEEQASLKEVKAFLENYLSLENKVGLVNELELYLRERGVISQKFGTSLDDLEQLSLELRLFFKQNRYPEIIKIGRLFQESFVVIPQAEKDEYINVLQILGDSCQKIDFLYDAGEFYQKALTIDPKNIETLMRAYQNCERLNDEMKGQEIKKKIEEILPPKVIDLGHFLLAKSQIFSEKLLFDGRELNLNLYFSKISEGPPPLLSVFFNGQVVWENYLQEDVLSLSLESKMGENELGIVAVNCPVSLVKITY